MKTILRCALAASLSLLLSHTSMATPNYNNLPLKTDQDTTTLSAYKGKVVLLDFWASWCSPCQQSFGWMNTLHERYRNDGLVIIAVNLDKNRALADRFLKKTPASFKVAYDPEGQLAKIFELQAMPSSYLIDQNGNIIHKHLGFKEADITAYEETIRELLLQKQIATAHPEP